ncbi:MAG: Pvc16 family protein [Candidatus Sulfotelmatobacter sp.]
MSDFFAVAGVTSVLKWLLSDALASAGLNSAFPTAASISALSPDLVATGATEVPQVNLFMYYANFNASYRNQALPSKDSSGNRVSNPPLALNLHYLVSAYGKNELDPEILLAWTMQLFHENAIMSRQSVQTLLTAMGSSLGATPEMIAVAKTDLAEQVELIKILPEALSNEEISKLWMAFNTHYRPTTSYQVSVVLIQEKQAFKSNLPVQSRKVKAIPLAGPTIENVTPASANVGDVLTITGRNFVGDSAADTLIAFDDNLPITPDSVQSTAIRVKVPGTLQPGTRAIRVIRNVTFGVSTDPHAAFASTPAQFSLMPQVTNASPVAGTLGSALALNVVPAVGRQQAAALYIGDVAIELPMRPPTDPATSSTLTFNIPASFPHTTPPIALPLRLAVDGVQSKLTLDTNSASPTFGQFLPQAKVGP